MALAQAGQVAKATATATGGMESGSGSGESLLQIHAWTPLVGAFLCSSPVV